MIEHVLLSTKLWMSALNLFKVKVSGAYTLIMLDYFKFFSWAQEKMHTCLAIAFENLL